MSVDQELNNVSIWINHCLSRMVLNGQFKTLSRLHIYSFSEFMTSTIDNSKMDKEPLIDHWIRIHNLKPLF